MILKHCKAMFEDPGAGDILDTLSLICQRVEVIVESPLQSVGGREVKKDREKGRKGFIKGESKRE